MADITIPQAPAAAPILDPTEHNAQVARHVESQDAAGHSTVAKPGEFEEVSSALDKLAAAAGKPVDPLVSPSATEDSAAKQAAEEAASAQKKEADAKEAEAKAIADGVAKKAEELFQEIPALPEGASKKASESFQALKIQAAKDISERDAKISELGKQLNDIQEAAKNPTTEQLEKDKELERLRGQLAKLDVEFDPKFKEFDGKVQDIENYVYAELKKNPVVTDDIINEIKKFGGLANVNLTKLFEAMKDPSTQRIVESKIADVRMLQYNKDQALKQTKENITGYLAERQKTYQDAVLSHTKNTEAHLTKMLSALDWMKERPVEGDDSAKKSAQDHNTMLGAIKQDVSAALQDDSPQMRAILLTGYAQMCNLQGVTKSQTAQIEALTKQLADIIKKYEAVKSSSTSRLRESSAPSGGTLLQSKPSAQFNTLAADALDSIAKQVMQEREARGIK